MNKSLFLLIPTLLLGFSCSNSESPKQSSSVATHQITLIQMVYCKMNFKNMVGYYPNTINSSIYPYASDIPSIDFPCEIVFDEETILSPTINISVSSVHTEFRYVDKDGNWNKTFEPVKYDHLILVAYDSSLAESFPAEISIIKAFYETPASLDAINKLTFE